MSGAKRALLCVLSAGWLFPMYVAADLYFGVLARVQLFNSAGGVGLPSAAAGTSFPVEEFTIQASEVALGIAFLWLAATLVFWALYLTRSPKADGSLP